MEQTNLIIQKKVRDSNLELFRIITMLLIVAHHYVVNSGLLDVNGPILSNSFSCDSLFLLIVGAWGKTGINCFVLITGYFMVKSEISMRKFLKLFLEFMFYKIVIGLIFIFSGYQTFGWKKLVKLFIPIFSVEQNFISCYLLFFLFIPFLNLLIRNLNEKKHIILLLLCSVTYVFFGTFHKVAMNYVSWFMVLYVISSYIRLYPKTWMNSLGFSFFMLIISVSLSVLSVIACSWKGIFPYYFVIDSNTFLAVLTGLFAFLFFKNLKIPYNKFINTVASTSLGILLIHANSDTMRQWLWKDMLDNVGHYGNSWYVIYSTVGVFIICSIIDLLRIIFIEKLFFKFWDKNEYKICNFFNPNKEENV